MTQVGATDFGLRGHVRAFKSGDMSPYSKSTLDFDLRDRSWVYARDPRNF